MPVDRMLSSRLVVVVSESVYTVLVFCFLSTLTTADINIVSPVSVSEVVGENALFHCAGKGFVIAWLVDGISSNHPDIVARGVSDNTVSSSSSGTIQSTLTVPATLVNNGTTVQCRVISLNSQIAISNNASLTILPGIGPVVNMRFTLSFSAVLWDLPATAGVLSGLSYIVIVMNNNTGQVIVSDTTTNTIYPLPVLVLCQYYTANVTAFSSQYYSESVVTGQRIPGEHYDLTSSSVARVVIYNTTHCAVTFTINIQQRGVSVCPDQKLMSVTYPTEDNLIRTQQPFVCITEHGVMNYTVYVESGYQCQSDIMIVADDKQVDMKSVNFSSYNVQDCHVSSDQHTSSILVKCTFAINSTAPGIVVIQDDQSQYTINKTLQRLLQDIDKGSVNITGLPAGEYSVRVYDREEDLNDVNSFAFVRSKLLHTVGITSSETHNLELPTSVITSVSSLVLDSSVTPSVVHLHGTSVIAIAVSFGLSIFFVMTTLLSMVVMVVFVYVKWHVRKKITSEAVSTNYIIKKDKCSAVDCGPNSQKVKFSPAHLNKGHKGHFVVSTMTKFYV